MVEAFLQDLAMVLIVAGIVTVIFHRLKQPVVLGYILAGLIVGPHTPNIFLVHDEHMIELLSHLGVILLMFGLGLHFSLRQLAQVGITAFTAATLEILLMFAAGYGIGFAFGWGQMDSIFLGAMLSMSSTTIIIKALQDLGLIKERFAQLMFGILVVEDILAIAMIALLSSIAKTGSLQGGEVLMTLGRLGIFLTITLVVGLLVVPWMLRLVSRVQSNEMLLVASLGLCFGMSLLAMKMGYSEALGAFLIGAIVAETREHGKIETLVEPVRDMFSAVFFVSIGMLIDPRMLVTYAVPIAVITLAVLVGKVLSCTLGTFVAGNNMRTSLKVGMGLAQIGEFSFIIASLGLSLKVTSEFLYPIVVMVSAITTLLTPYQIKSSDPLSTWFEKHAPRWITDFLELYSRWILRLKESPSHGQPLRKMARRWVLQIALNLVLVTGLLIAAAWAAGLPAVAKMAAPAWVGGTRGAVWGVAMLVSLPILIAVMRKMRAIAMLIAELTVTEAAGKQNTAGVRAIVSAVILGIAAAAMMLWILIVSSALLPPWPVLIAFLLILTLVGGFMWQRFIRVYAQAQATLHETLTEKPAEAELRAELRNVPPALAGAELLEVTLADGSPGRGRLIRELELRRKSGASIVAIDREGTPIINPSPDEELKAGDRLLILGNPVQLAAARGAFGVAPMA